MSDYYPADGLPPFGDDPSPWDDDDALEAGLAFRREVADELHRLRVRQAAQEALRAEREPVREPFDAGSLAELLARPAPPPMRADGLVPADASVLLVAQRKTGKTTTVLNYARHLLTGGEFLGRFDVRPLSGSVVILNYEVSGYTLARWAHEVGVDPHRLHVVNLRGKRNPLSHPEDRAALAQLLRGWDTEAVICDPFGRAYSGASQNDSGEVGAWLVGLDRFVRAEVGASDLVLTAHAGWNGERTRGASALEDWADVIVTLTRDPGDEAQRFLRAVGRDVEVDEDRIDYDPETRRLTLAGVGSRKQAHEDRKVAELAVYVLRAVREEQGRSTAAIESAIRDMPDAPTFRNGEVSRAAKYACQHGHIRLDPGGRGRPTLHYLAPTAPQGPGEVTSPGIAAGQNLSQPLPNLSPGALSTTSPTSPIGERWRWEGSERVPLPDEEAS